jgi:hypothetical protein
MEKKEGVAALQAETTVECGRRPYILGGLPLLDSKLSFSGLWRQWATKRTNETRTKVP